MKKTEEAQLEPWARQIRSTYERRESATFALHNNIADLFPWEDTFISCRVYLERMLDRRNYVIIGYDVSRGLKFYRDEDAAHFVRLANQGRPADDPLIRNVYDFPHDGQKALSFVEALVTDVSATNRPIAILIDFADDLVPGPSAGPLSESARMNAVTIERFARLFYDRLQEPGQTDAVLCLLTPNLHDLHPDIVVSEHVCPINVPRPDARLRRYYTQKTIERLEAEGRAVRLEDDLDRFVDQTAGLTLTGMYHIFIRAAQSEAKRLSSADVFKRKRELLARDSRGMLDIVSPRHGMDAVGGHKTIKAMLSATASDLKSGETDVPVGIVFPGPNGVGKTFIAKAFAKDSGLNCVSLRNFRGMYVGQTESNLELIFSILRSMTPNCVIVDEADKMLGNEKGDSSSGVDERVFGAITAFMGDPAYRGKIFWLLLTARPFELAPDTGRPGRVEEHVPILPPETLDDRRSILLAVARANGVDLVTDAGEPWTDREFEQFFEQIGTVTPAAIELMVNRARRHSRRALEAGLRPKAGGPIRVTFQTMLVEGRDYVVDGTDGKIQLQILDAVLYTNHLQYLPEPWRERVSRAPEELALLRARLRRELGYESA